MLYEYNARLDRVVDGDTVDMVIDVGFRVTTHQRLRLLGVNAPEMRGDSAEAGLAARAFVVAWFEVEDDAGFPFTVATSKSDSFGRWLAEVWRRDGEALTVALRMAGHAETWTR